MDKTKYLLHAFEGEPEHEGWLPNMAISVVVAGCLLACYVFAAALDRLDEAKPSQPSEIAETERRVAEAYQRGRADAIAQPDGLDVARACFAMRGVR